MRAMLLLLGLCLGEGTLGGVALAGDGEPPDATVAPPSPSAPSADGSADPGAAPASAPEAPPADVLVPDPSAPPLPPEAVSPPPEQAPDIAGWSYQDGALAGAQDARIAQGYGLHALGGLAAGLVCGACGCVGAPAVEMVVSPGVPAGPWQGFDSAYQRGYIDAYRRTMRQRRAAYAFAGAGVGAAATFMVGFAYGLYSGGVDFF